VILDFSEHEMVEFKILRAGRRVKSKLTTLDFRRADFGLFKDLLGILFRDKSLEGTEGPRKMINIGELPPPSSREFHLNKYNFK